MKNLFYLIIPIFILIVSSCGTKIDPYTNNNSDSEYFPLKVGYTWIYEVDSIIFDNKGTKIDSTHSIIKESISGTFTDNEGNTAYIIERFKQNNQNIENWSILDAWFAYKNDMQAVKNEENLKFIKLVFPVEKDVVWDGNAYFDSENTIVKIAGEPIKIYEYWTYKYLDIDSKETINDIQYDNVATVLQVDYENSIEKRYSIEKYAKDTGLIYKNMIILNTQKIDQPNTPWEKKAEEGFILTQKLISFSEN